MMSYSGNASAQYVRDYMQMTLKEIVDNHLKTCSKSNGLVSVCKKCKTPCMYGKRAVDLAYGGTSVNNEPAPLFEGLTMVEKGKQETAELRKKSDWYFEAEKSNSPIGYVMKTFNIDTKMAEKKLTQRRWYEKKMARKREEEARQREMLLQKLNKEEKNVQKEKPVEEEKEKPAKEEPKNTNFVADNAYLEGKLEALMKQQEQAKQKMDEQYKLYEKAKAEYEKIKAKADVLCNAMDIISEM